MAGMLPLSLKCSVVSLLMLLGLSIYCDGLKHLKLGILIPWSGNVDLDYDFRGQHNVGAINLAIETISEMDMVEQLEFSIVTRDSKCDSKASAAGTVELIFDEDVDVIIGPPCSVACFPAAQLASYWDIPIISWFAINRSFNDKNYYTTLARTFGPFSRMAEFFLMIFSKYNWDRVVLLSSTELLWDDACQTFVRVFEDTNVTVAYYGQYTTLTSKKLNNLFLNVEEEGRIVIMCVPRIDRRKIMLRAYDRGMCDGSYVFYTVDMLPVDDIKDLLSTFPGNDGRDEDVLKAFEAVFQVSLSERAKETRAEFRDDVLTKLNESPWNSTTYDVTPTAPRGSRFAGFLHDAVLLYSLAINTTLAAGFNIRNGVNVINRIKNTYYQGMTGKVYIDETGDRSPDFEVTDLQVNGYMEKISELVNTEGSSTASQTVRTTTVFFELKDPRWPSGKVGADYAPPGVPECGFNNELCNYTSDNSSTYIIVFSLVFVAIVFGATLFILLYRKTQSENRLLSMRWKIDYDKINMIRQARAGSQPSLSSNDSDGEGDRISKATSKASTMHSSVTTSSGANHVFPVNVQLFTNVGRYYGTLVAIKHIQKDHIQITKNVLIELNETRDLNHENVNSFVGACIESPHICLLWHYCHKGSLQDVLENDEIKLDRSFKYSFLNDMCKGIEFLHKSKHSTGSHGNLKSTNCVIDNRWVLKVTDFGVPSFTQGQREVNVGEHEKYSRLLWTAPEILRLNFPPPNGTQKGDVYSFAIIVYEIINRSFPFTFDNVTPRDVVNRVRSGESTPYRPTLPIEDGDMGKGLVELMIHCWHEQPDQRPHFSKIRSELKKLSGDDLNIVDNILVMMEKYANNLEDVVEERTTQLVEEKKKTDRLLYRMLPPLVADQLKAGKPVQAESFDRATLYFSDIVGFTALSSESSPFQVVDLLNDLYSTFDDIIDKHDVYKVETIGDAYMVVSGLPQRNGNRHAAEIANCALDLLSTVTHFKIRHRPKDKLQLRIGIHTGPVVAGVVGLTMPRYCLFGDTVNIASRMESLGKPFHIHMSKQTYIALQEIDLGYQMESRGEINVKGKGLLTTYWLYGKVGYDKELPRMESPKLKEKGYGKLRRQQHKQDNQDPGPSTLEGKPDKFRDPEVRHVAEVHDIHKAEKLYTSTESGPMDKTRSIDSGFHSLQKATTLSGSSDKGSCDSNVPEYENVRVYEGGNNPIVEERDEGLSKVKSDSSSEDFTIAAEGNYKLM
ncbi:atrial natriuretic peptide receptor 1-like [Glandiceps talaboti]